MLIFLQLAASAQADWLDQYNVVWDSPSRDSFDSMPLPGSRGAGANVWVQDGSLWIYLAHNGAYNESGWLLKLGCLRLTPIGVDWREPAAFKQSQDLAAGTITVESTAKDGTQIKLRLRFLGESLLVDASASREIAWNVSYGTWRYDRQGGRYGRGIADIVGPSGDSLHFVHRNGDTKTEADLARNQGIAPEAMLNLLPHHNFGGAMAAQGGLSFAEPVPVSWQTWQGMAWTGKTILAKQQTVSVALGAGKNAEPAQWEETARSLLKPDVRRAAEAAEDTRWSEFWNRSYVIVAPGSDAKDPAFQIGRNYQLFRQMLACNQGGELPLKFNGGIFTTEPHPERIPARLNNPQIGFANDQGSNPDYRRWGQMFFGQNQRWLGWPAVAAGDADLLSPSIKFYRDRLAIAKERAKNLKAEGACYPEALGLDGTICVGPTSQSMCGAPHLTYHFSMGLEHAWMALLGHSIMGTDIDADIPWMVGIVRFLDSFYRAQTLARTKQELGDDGKLVLYPSNGLELLIGGTNTIETVAGLHRVIEGLLALPQLSVADREFLAGVKNTLPDLPTMTRDGKQVLAPAAKWEREDNPWEFPEMYAAWPYRLVGVTRPETLELARDTWAGVPPRGGIRSELFCKKYDFSWQSLVAYAAALRLPEVKPLVLAKLSDAASCSRYPAFFGPGHDWMPDHNWGGAGMVGLQEMLLAADPGPNGKLFLFPAWPEAWDVHFKLHAPQNTTVECELRGGKIVKLEVTPESRRKDVEILGSIASRAVRADAIVAAPPAESFQRTLAAREIHRYVYLRTGRLLPVSTELPADGDVIIVACKGLPKEFLPTDASTDRAIQALKPQEYLLKTVPMGDRRALLIVGGDDVGALYGAYVFAEKLGVRFYLHGDVIPDRKIAWQFPDLDETGKPLFELRGIQPFHDFPEGPDWWNLDDYKAHIAQLPKMRMNFIGFHTYPEPYDGGEPTVWIGTEDDIGPDGRVKFSQHTTWFRTNSMGWGWGYGNMPTSDYLFGASQLFDRDDNGSDVFRGIGPLPHNGAWGKAGEWGVCAQKKEDEKQDIQQSNEVFYRTGQMLREVFTVARSLGVKTCLGTESVLTVPKRVGQRIQASGKMPGFDPYRLPHSPEALKAIYKGMFKRIMQTHPLDYYWLWTSETNFSQYHPLIDVANRDGSGYKYPRSGAFRNDNGRAVVQDMSAAYEALSEIGRPFQLVTCGWRFGTPQDPTLLDKALPLDVSLSAINGGLGAHPVDPAMNRLRPGRAAWAIPWLEDDGAMTTPQFWVGRTRRDAALALEYGCKGLMGIHWRTRAIAPMIGALAHAGWDQTVWNPNSANINARPPKTDGKNTGAGDASIRKADDFYADWTRTEFGPEVAEPLTALFLRLEKGVPRPCGWEDGPGLITPNVKPWNEVKGQYAFVEEFESLRPHVRGKGNLDRFDYWLNTFRYLRAIAKTGCSYARFDAAMKTLRAEGDVEKKKLMAREEAIPLRKALIADIRELTAYSMKRATNPGDLGSVATIQVKTVPRMLELPGRELAQILGGKLPEDALPAKSYESDPILLVPTVRTIVEEGESVAIKIFFVDKNAPKQATLYWRPMGADEEYASIAFSPVARGIHKAALPSAKGLALEYYIEVETSSGAALRFPATAPELCQTVVVVPKERKED